ncbi:MAG: protein disulfide isomerase family protein [Candidatus Gastranaerophilales bacterium]|nr:protein disulfide isomerase family protein [Candidatus Gastranaerophilales bacterium]
MFDEKIIGKIVWANLALTVAVLLLSVVMFSKLFIPEGTIAAAAPDRAAAPSHQAAQPANDEKISKKYDTRMTLEKALQKGKPVAVLFYADWCGFCKRFAPTFDELAKDKDLKKKYTFAYVNSDSPDSRALMQQYNVRGFPTLYLINPKTIDKAHVSNSLMFGADAFGTMKEQFEKFVEEGSSAVTQPPAPQAPKEED